VRILPEVLPRHYVFGLIIFTLIISAGLIMISGFSEKQSTFVDDSSNYSQFDSSFNQFSALNESIKGIHGFQDSASQKPTDGLNLGVLNGIINGVWNAVTLLFTSLGFGGSILNGFGLVFGIPPIFGILIGLLITAMLAFAIFTLAFYREV
jgi:hypothetical protein